ncbi:hypothetical protein BB8028_0007g05960 [Beauveria bassiana]|uniref:JmjC domain-containing protein n=3 Tax=Beauveria bassiana TaxID=176275 RepID=A0A2S7YMI9_BEABA|nr:hypothetical protein BB8028_0007g05960 [Beauveria bassiana]
MPCISSCRSTARLFHSSLRRRRTVLPVQNIDWNATADSIQSFRHGAFAEKRPVIFRKDHGSPTSSIPALTKWFQGPAQGSVAGGRLSKQLEEFHLLPFPYEIVGASKENLQAINSFCTSLIASQDMQDQIIAGILHSTLADSAGDRFFQLFAPLKLLHKALEFNQLRKASGESTVELYIAQSLLADLPTRLQQDVPTPTLVLEAGKGDVYSSSIWLGTEPTYTPLHRDPNPNLFCQLHNQKVVRLLPPQLGEKLYLQVQVQLRLQGSSRMRGVEMMEGEERKVLQEAVWEPETPIEEMCEAELDAGDALFIPEGWWHSVKSSGASGDLNGSVNWWFR